jgi:tetratricopeptide (TPR) repeat protein
MAKRRLKEARPAPPPPTRGRLRLRLVLPLLLAAGAIAAIALIVTRRSQPDDDAPLTAFPAPPGVPADTIQRDDFVGAAVCGSCHQAQHAAWSTSTHGRAGEAPPRELLLRRFDGTPIRFRDATVEPRVTGGQYEFVVRWVERVDRYPIVGVVGAGHMVGGGTQGFLWRHPDGSLRLLPFEITRTDSTWFCSTGTRADRGWQPITDSMSIADCGDWPPTRVMGSSPRYATCQECHGSQIELRAGERPSESHFESLAINCESCHGPGRRHTELARTPNRTDLGIDRLADAAAANSVNVCMRCHSLKVDVRFGYLPGRELEDRYSLKFALLGGDEVYPDGRTRTFAYQQGHYYSDCYLTGAMTCVDCHEPHGQSYRDINRRALADRFDDAQCTDCHPSKAEPAQAHTKHPAGSAGSRCVACHMPYLQEPAVGTQIRYTRSDHTISVPRPEVDQRLGIVNACVTCHQDRSPDQLAQDTRRLWGDLKPLRPIVGGLVNDPSLDRLEQILIASDTAHTFAYFDALSRYFTRMPGPDARALSRPIRALLERLASSRDDDHAALALAILHYDAGRDPRTRERLAEQLRALGPRDLRVRRRWAIALGHRADELKETNRLPDALIVYEKTVELLPNDAAFLQALGVARLDRGDAAGASDALRAAVSADPTNSLALVNYGRARGAAGDDAGAQAAYLRATEVNPYDALAFFNLGNTYMRQQNRAAAARAYDRAIELDVSLAPAHFNRARVYLFEEKRAEALRAIRAGLIFDPQNQEARNAAGELEQERSAPPVPKTRQ